MMIKKAAIFELLFDNNFSKSNSNLPPFVLSFPTSADDVQKFEFSPPHFVY